MKGRIKYQNIMKLSKLQEIVVGYYSEHPGGTRVECCREVYGRCDIFLLSNLGSIESQLRKKGFLFYSVDGRVIDFNSDDVPPSEKMKVQRRLGSSMLGIIGSNVRIMAAIDNPALMIQAQETMKQASRLLLQARPNGNKRTAHKQITSRSKATAKV